MVERVRKFENQETWVFFLLKGFQEMVSGQGNEHLLLSHLIPSTLLEVLFQFPKQRWLREDDSLTLPTHDLGHGFVFGAESYPPLHP